MSAILKTPKPPPSNHTPTLTASQQKALQIVSSPDLLDSLTESQKITLLLDLNMGQQAKIDALSGAFHDFKLWVQNRFYVAAISGALGGAGIGYGGTKALGVMLPWFM